MIDNRSKILDKIAAMMALVDHPNTPEHEVSAAMDMIERLRAKYNISEKDIKFSQADMGASHIKEEGKQVHPMMFCVLNIAKLTDTVLVYPTKNDCFFVGSKPDTEYANWLYRIINRSLERGLHEYKYSYEYLNLTKKEKVHGRTLTNSYQKSFIHAINKKLLAYIAEKEGCPVAGNKLVVVNQYLQTINANAAKPKKGKTFKLNDHGTQDGDKVGLRMEFTKEQTKLLT